MIVIQYEIEEQACVFTWFLYKSSIEDPRDQYTQYEKHMEELRDCTSCAEAPKLRAFLNLTRKFDQCFTIVTRQRKLLGSEVRFSIPTRHQQAWKSITFWSWWNKNWMTSHRCQTPETQANRNEELQKSLLYNQAQFLLNQCSLDFKAVLGFKTCWAGVITRCHDLLRCRNHKQKKQAQEILFPCVHAH